MKNKKQIIIYLFLLLLISVGSSFAANYCESKGCVSGSDTNTGATCTGADPNIVCSDGRCMGFYSGGSIVNCCCPVKSCDEACQGVMASANRNFESGRDWNALNQCNPYERTVAFSSSMGFVGGPDSQNMCCCLPPPSCGNNPGDANNPPEGCAGYESPGRHLPIGSSCTNREVEEKNCCCPLDCNMICGGAGPNSPVPTSGPCPASTIQNGQCCCGFNCSNQALGFCEGFDQGGYLNPGTCNDNDVANGPNSECCCPGDFNPPPGLSTCP